MLKLHSQLSGVPDSYNPEEEEDGGDSGIRESRIGDGPFFVGKLLRKIARLDPTCKQSIIETRNTLWPRKQRCEDEQREKEHREKEEKRKRAKERQQKLIAEFASIRKQFMETAMKTGELF